MKANTIKSWFYVHKWTSLICTTFLLLLCLTGLPLIFTDEIHHWMEEDADAPALPANTPKAPIDEVINSAKNHLPGKEMKYIYWDEDKEPGKMFFTLADSSSAPETANSYLTMDSRTAKVLQTPVNEMDFMDIMYHLHVDLMAGLPGMLSKMMDIVISGEIFSQIWPNNDLIFGRKQHSLPYLEMCLDFIFFGSFLYCS